MICEANLKINYFLLKRNGKNLANKDGREKESERGIRAPESDHFLPPQGKKEISKISLRRASAPPRCEMTWRCVRLPSCSATRPPWTFVTRLQQPACPSQLPSRVAGGEPLRILPVEYVHDLERAARGRRRGPRRSSIKNYLSNFFCTPMCLRTLSFCRLSNKRLTQPAARAEPGMAPPHCRDCRIGRGSPFLATLAAASCTARASAKVTQLARESIATAWTKCASAAPAPHTLRLATHVENELVVTPTAIRVIQAGLERDVPQSIGPAPRSAVHVN